MPFVDLLESKVDHCDLDALANGTVVDFRRAAASGSEAPLYVDRSRAGAFETSCSSLVGEDVAFEASRVRLSHGRSVVLDAATSAPRALRATFGDLCARPLSASDFHAICDDFDALFLSRVPRLEIEKHDEVRRFIALVDVFYDRGKAIVVEADAPLDALLVAARSEEDHPSGGDFRVKDEGGSSGTLTTFHADGTEWSATGLIGASMGAVSGAADTQFAWDRTTSRLYEMTTGSSYRDTWRRRYHPQHQSPSGLESRS